MFIILKNEPLENFKKFGGGKAFNMARMTALDIPVPDWFCVSSEAMKHFIQSNRLAQKIRVTTNFKETAAAIERLFLEHPLPMDLERAVTTELLKLGDRFVAVRSSGLDEDSAQNSFAGQFSSYMFQKGREAIFTSIKKCWASGYSERALSYRVERGLGTDNIQVGVVIQLMVNSTASGVAFSRNPIKPLDRDTILVSSVWGLGEGLVSGELDADHFEVQRSDWKFKAEVTPKPHALRQSPKGGLVKLEVDSADRERPSLTDFQVREVAKLTSKLEEKCGGVPQDCEWGYEGDKLYCLQTRPITNLPPVAFFDKTVNGQVPTLWDNSNIIESYSGVTSPLTFSFASYAYRQVYIQFSQMMGVPQKWIDESEDVFRNMLGLIRGRVFYNLINWYKLVIMLPGASTNKAFMETMMGVKQHLKPEVAKLFDFADRPPEYSLVSKVVLTWKTLRRFQNMDSIIGEFNRHFVANYEASRKLDLKNLSFDELAAHYRKLENEVLRRWQAPIINDYLCMIFFGLLKKLTEKWLAPGSEGSSLQNDLLCGEGDLESTEPTKMLMRLADKIDNGDPSVRSWLLEGKPAALWEQMQAGSQPSVKADFDIFLDKYGFRCINELKLEEIDLHDDPAFVIQSVQSYVRMKAYSVKAMEEREQAIRAAAEKQVHAKISGPKKMFFFWILRQARRAVRNRENLRFARTKIFGVVRHIFRAMGDKLTRLGFLNSPQDIFYLTVEEIFAFHEGRGLVVDLKKLVAIRRQEFDEFKRTPPPPERHLTYGPVGASFPHLNVLLQTDLLAQDRPVSTDPNVLIGTPCCPGIVEGVVRVVIEMKDAEDINGEILVTERTDPGWVPLYPSCSGLLIERGSLLSHSAVVARELGLPTIVGISGGLMKKLKSGQKVRIDAGRGEIRILE